MKRDTKWLDKADPDEPLPIRPTIAQVGNEDYLIVPDVQFRARNRLPEIIMIVTGVGFLIWTIVYYILSNF